MAKIGSAAYDKRFRRLSLALEISLYVVKTLTGTGTIPTADGEKRGTSPRDVYNLHFHVVYKATPFSWI